MRKKVMLESYKILLVLIMPPWFYYLHLALWGEPSPHFSDDSVEA